MAWVLNMFMSLTPSFDEAYFSIKYIDQLSAKINAFQQDTKMPAGKMPGIHLIEFYDNL